MNQKSALLTYVVVSNERNTRVMSNEKWERPTLLIYQIKFTPTETTSHLPRRCLIRTLGVGTKPLQKSCVLTPKLTNLLD